MIKKTLIVLCTAIILMSCNKISDIPTDLRNDYNHYDFLNSSTKIAIVSKPENSKLDSTTSTKLYEAKTAKELQGFKDLFENAEKTDYCCCPKENYIISFYYFKNNFNYYLVDTTEFKNKIRIYERSYQYSYLINRESWNNYLKEISKK